MNCGSCIHEEDFCKYKDYKKCIDNDLFHLNFKNIFKLQCSKYESKIYFISKEQSMLDLGITQEEIDSCGEVEFE